MAADQGARSVASAVISAPLWAQTVVDRFDELARRRPDAVAASFGGAQLTYAALNARANRVAHGLVAQGKAADPRVGVCVDRPLDVVVGTLGILKSGAAYVPFDSSHPSHTLERQIADSGVTIVLTHGATAHAALQSWEGAILDLAAESHAEELSGGRRPRPTIGSFVSLSPFALSLGHIANREAARSLQIAQLKESLAAAPPSGDGVLRALAAAAGIDLASRPPITFNAVGPPAQHAGFFRIRNQPKGRRAEPGLHTLDVFVAPVDGCLRVQAIFSPDGLKAAQVSALMEAVRRQLDTAPSHGHFGHAEGTPPDLTPPLTSDGLQLGLEHSRLDGVQVEDVLPLTPMQEAIVFHQRRHPDSQAYVQQVSLQLRGALQREAFVAAWQALARRHEALRVRIAFDGATPRQLVLRTPDFASRWVERGDLDVLRTADRHLDLEHGPLWRVSGVQTGPDTHEVIWTFSHVLLDGWCFGILFQELGELYGAFATGREPSLPPPVCFRGYLKWLASRDLSAARRAFSALLAGFREPTGVPRDTAIGATRDPRQIGFAFGAQTTAGLQTLAARVGVTLGALLQAAWAVLLARYNQTTDVLYGLTVSGRPPELPGALHMVGCFINTLPIRVQVTPDHDIAQLARAVQDTFLALQDHQYLPLADIQSLSPLRSSLLDHVFVFENYPLHASVSAVLPGVTVGSTQVLEHLPYDFGLICAVAQGHVHFRVHFDRAAYPDERIAALARHFERICTRVVAEPEARLRDIDVIDDAERARVVVDWNRTATPLPQARTIVDVFEEQCQRTPDRLALRGELGGRSYADVNRRANQIAHALRSDAGVRLDDPVGVCLPRSMTLVTAILAILKSGGAYLPLDPALPPARLRALLSDSGVSCVLGDPESADRIGAFSGTVIDVDRIARETDEGEDNPPRWPLPSSLAYVIYTSGSSGRPKGVLIQHESVMNRLHWMQRAFPLDDTDVLLQKTPFGFDVSVWELLWWSFVGASLAVLPQGLERDPAAIVKAVARHGVTTLHFVPSMLDAFLTHLEEHGGQTDLASLRRVFVSGEELLGRQIERFRALLGVPLLNLYGPTEATVDVSYFDTRVWKGGGVPIGRPIDNTGLFVLDRELAPLPIGVPGEIAIGGMGLARGYLGNPALTADRFRPDPFGVGSRVYRTGDRGRFGPDGQLHFLGRLDAQMKVRGQRVEPGEIESHLLAQPGVEQAAVGLVDGDLVAYVVGEVDGLRARLLETLPEALVPSFFVRLDALPLTANGKLDRRALPSPSRDVPQDAGPPRDGVERAVLGAFAEVLGVRVARGESFFDRGGHSLKALRAASRVGRDLGVEVSVGDLFAHPTAEALAALLRGRAPVCVLPIVPAEHEGDAPASHAQRRMWVLSQMGGRYHVPGAVRVRGDLHVPRLRAAVQRLAARHEALRTRFVIESGELRQRVASDPHAEVRVADLRGAADLAAALNEEAARPFDLERGPLMRIALLERGERDFVLTLTLHHIVSDAWSVGVLLHELMALYAGDTLPAAYLQYRDYSLWQGQLLETGAMVRHREYWRAVFSEPVSALDLPADRPRPLERSVAGDRVWLVIGETELAGLRGVGARKGASLFMVLVTLVKVLLYRYTGEPDVTVGTPVSGRERAELEGVVGLFVNTVVLRDPLRGEESFERLLARVRDTALRAFEHQVYPFDLLVEEVGARADLSRNPLFDVMVGLADTAPDLRLAGLDVEPIPLTYTEARFDLTFAFAELPSGLGLSLEYSSELFDRGRIERMATHLHRLVQAVLADASQAVGRLPLRSAADVAFAQRHGGPPPAAARRETVLDLFDRHVEQSPAAPAARSGSDTLSYRMLDEQANALAHHLKGFGVGPEARVALCLPPSLEALIAVLGILKAGGAYVPLDPDLPSARLDVLLADTAPAAVITRQSVSTPHGAYRFGEWPARTDRLSDRPAAEQAAYVLYTSGSTGTPKGVIVEHASLANYLRSAVEVYGEGDFPLFTSLSVDLTVTSMFLPLVTGRTVHLATGDAGEVLQQAFGRGAVDCVKLTPSHVALLASLELSETRVRLAIVGGEALGRAHVDTLRRLNPRIRIVNEYGPTEATVGCVAADVTERAVFHIGRPTAGASVWVVERDGELAPAGVWGELYVAGPGLARGYLGRPDLTAERFVRPDFAGGERCYRTGDRVRFLDDGELEYGGRLDDQVKVRGHRVELGEVEFHLAAQAGVEQSAVVLRDGELVAYVVGATDDLQRRLRDVLPAALVPGRIVRLSALPLLPSGKLDRRALPPPPAESAEPADAHDSTERTVLAVFTQVLGKRLGRSDDFFAAGGDSLKAIQAAIGLRRELGVEMSLREIFAYPTAACLAGVVRGLAPARLVSIERVPDAADYAVSRAQRRMWVLVQMGGQYGMPGAVRLRGPLDIERLHAAWRGVVARHESLRTRFVMSGAELRQRVDSDEATNLRITDLRGESDPERCARQQLLADASQAFDLEHGPLVRVRLLELGAFDHILMLTLHHIVGDGWSIAVLFREVMALYAGTELPPLEFQYRDYAAWQHEQIAGTRMGSHRDHWLSVLAGEPPVLDLPNDHPRPTVRSFAGDRVWLELDAVERAGLLELGRQGGATLFMTLVAVVKVLLYRYTGQTDVMVGSPVSGREDGKFEHQVGLYVNTVVLRDKVRPDQGFDRLLQQVKQTAVLAYQHQSYPFDLLVEEVAGHRDLGRNPLFDVMVLLAPPEAAVGGSPAGVEVSSVPLEVHESRFDLTFAFGDAAGALGLSIEYSTELFERETVARIGEHLRTLVRSLLAHPATPVGLLAMATDAEALDPCAARPAGSLASPSRTIVDLFEAQVRRTPDRLALVHGERTLTYRDLATRANGVAHRLAATGDVSGHVIAVACARSEWLVVACLGILKAGAAYLPLDTTNPASRLAEIAADSGAALVLTDAVYENGLDITALASAVEAPAVVVHPSDLAYVIYTSGSSGRPKGVAVEHAAFVNMAVAQIDNLGITADDRMAQFSAPGFDASLYEMFLALCGGASLTIVPESAKRDRTGFLDWLERDRPTVLVLPPSFLHALDQAPLPRVRVLVTAGEVARPEDARHYARALRSINAYGPTEFAVCATWHEVEAEGSGRIPIGRPIANTAAYVLDDLLQPLPAGVPGELYLGGAGVARGYLGRFDLTAERFVPDPFTPGARLFRTGDRVCRGKDGTLHFLGRVDHQIKLRGYRIEPGEIEHHLRQHPGISDAAVIERGGELLAYVAGSIAGVREHLLERLPPFMVPGRFMSLPRLPLTRSGKLDRRALPDPAVASPGGRAARDEAERRLLEIFADVLGAPPGLDDDFFLNGGHSLRAMQVASRIRRDLGVALPLRAVFLHPTVSALAVIVRSLETRPSTPIPALPAASDYPASHAQRRLWVLSRLGGGYVLPAAVLIDGPLDRERLQQALRELVVRHESLRTYFVLVDAELRQRVDPVPDVILPCIKLPGEAEAQAWLRAESDRSFDLASGPLWRFALLELSPDRHVLTLMLHHAIADAWSLDVLVGELTALYAERPLPALPIQYRDFAAWQQQRLASGALDRDRDYWHRQLGAELPVLDLPTDQVRPAVRNFAGEAVRFTFERQDLTGLEALGRRGDASLFMVLLAVVKVLLHRYTGQTDVVVGSPIAGRSRLELDDQVGLFVNTVALRDRVRPGEGFAGLLQRVRDTALAAYEHAEYPFDLLVDELGVARDLARSPIVDVMMVLQEAPRHALSLGAATWRPFPLDWTESKFDLTFGFARDGDGLSAEIVYSRELFSPERISRLSRHLQCLVQALLCDPHQPVATLAIEPAVERRLPEAVPFPRERTVVSLFEEQVRRTPRSLAVVHASHHLTYADLNARANGVARFLREAHGVAVEDRVGVCLESSEWLIVAALGVFKAGAVYVPIPVDAGPVRTAAILSDSHCRVVLGGPGAAAGGVDVSRIAAEADNPPRIADAGNLAYVIYTSGSSGQPKGVLVEHRALVNLACWHASAFGLSPASRATLYASIGFDASVWETWPYLLCGGCVFPLADELRLDLSRLSRFVREQAMTHVFVPTPIVEPLLALDPLHGVTILTGGETLHLADRPPRVIVNNYGPTEAAVVATSVPINAEGVAALGSRIDNVDVLVLDPSGEVVPPGVDGEICLAGISLARGYANDAGLTAARFMPHPWHAGARIYRTGDRGRVGFDGALWFRGRLDDQVKVRGHRVEPGEVEFQLMAQPGVRHAAVVLRHGSLVAYVVGEVDGLKERLRALLPDALVPSRIVSMETLPLTARGKVDRLRLSKTPLEDAPATEPRDEVERLVLAALTEVLGRRVACDENFFDAGGHSLKAVQLSARLARDVGVDVPLRAVFMHPTAVRLSEVVRGLAPVRFEAITRVPDAEHYPASYAQRRMWVLAQMGRRNHVPGAVRLRGELNNDRLLAAIRGVVARHESLRARFVMTDEGLRQRVSPDAEIEVRVTTMRGASEVQIRESLRVEQARVFDLEHGPLVRVTLLEVGPGDVVLLMVLHHIASDGESMGTLLRDVMSIYQGVDLPALAWHYRDCAAWQQRLIDAGAMQRHREYWRSALTADLAPLDLPADRPRPLLRTFAGDQLRVTLAPAELSCLLELGAHSGASLFMTLLALVKVLLYRLTGQDDVVVGSPVAGRTRAELEDQVGLFVNTVVLRDQVRGGESFADFLLRVRETSLQAYQHQAYPFDLLVDDVSAPRDLGRNPLFDVMVSLTPEADARSRLSLPGIEITPISLESAESKFDLTFGFAQVAGSLWLNLEYSTELFERSRIERVASHFCTLVRSVLADASVPIGRLEIVGPAQAHALGGYHGRQVAHAIDETVMARFERQAQEVPDAVAVRGGETSMSYRDLNRRADRLALCLRGLGVGPEVRVALCLERTADAVVAVLGILKAGGAFVPLDPALPPRRLGVLLSSTGPAVVVTQASLLDRLPATPASTLCIDRDWPLVTASDAMPERRGHHAAYVMYTSGSSGEPKGVVVEHANLNHYLHWAAGFYVAGRQGGDFPLFTSLGFDLTVTSLFLPLCLGRCVHVHAGDASEALAWAFSSGEVDSVKLTPSHITLLADLGLQETRVGLVVAGGEFLNWDHVSVLRRLNPSIRIVNEYGPTEATVGCVAGDVEGRSVGDVLIGRAIDNTTAWVVERDGQLAPVGVWGELLVGGAGVTRGYLGRDDLTAERFVRPAFANGSRCYRTGDRVRWVGDGELQYGGRLDDQLKLRGHRVEPGEIEFHLRALSGVEQARVVMRDGELVAYVVGETTQARERLRAVLPEALIPTHVVRLDEFPLGANGKLDRDRLPAPRLDPEPREEAADDLERAVLGAFARVLGRRLRREQSFFDAGGHSLKAIQVANQLSGDLGVDLTLRDVFANPTAASLAVAIRGRAPVRVAPVSRVADAPDYPVSHAQRRMWILAQMGIRYHMPGALRFRGELDRPRLLAAVRGVVDRHEALRSRFAMVDGQLRQRVAHDALAPIVVTLEGDGDRESRLNALVREDAERDFDLEHGPIVRARLVELATADMVLVLTMHHIASDGWSVDVLLREVIALYEGRTLPALHLQYRDYASWQNGLIAEGVMRRHREYWLRSLAGELQGLDLPSDRPRASQRGFASGRVFLELGERELGGLQALARSSGASLFMMLIALVKALLYRYTGQRDVIVGTPVSGRVRSELEGQVGLYANTVILRDPLRGEEPFVALLRRVRETALLAYEHQAYPFDLLVEEVAARRHPGRNPLFDVLVVLNSDDGAPEWNVPGLEVSSVPVDYGESKFDLTFSFAAHASALEIGIEYSADLFERPRVERMGEHLRMLARAVLADARTPVAALTMLTADDAAAVETPSGALPIGRETLVDLFEDQVERSPDRVAVIHRGRQLTYRELDQRANGLAHLLHSRGVGPGVTAGLCLDRSLDLIVGLLGILKAGAAYLPLDPTNPPARLTRMLADAKVPVLVTESSVVSALSPTGAITVCLDTESLPSASQPPAVPRDPRDAAYVIYTSGSTGVPKGVVVEHASVIRLFHATRGWTGFGADDVWAMFHSCGFDFSVWEMWGALLHGGRLVVVPTDIARSPEDFLALLDREGVTVLNQTPSAFESLMRSGADSASLPALRLVVFGGEALDPRRLRPWFARRGDSRPALVNMYGITETTVHVTWHRLTTAEAESPASPIGVPLADLRVYVLDRDLGTVPPGMPGEVFVSGAGLARGYSGRPDLTAERFLPDPWSPEPGGRMYRSGDLARRAVLNCGGTGIAADAGACPPSTYGGLEYLGRRDAQVKIRGFRIEPGEIEAILSQDPGVQSCLVMARSDGLPEPRLVAYVIPRGAAAVPRWREHLRAHLPEHMVPAAFVVLPSFPLTGHGKVDRAALPPPERIVTSVRAPRDAVEMALTQIVERILGHEGVGIRENFFDLGGDSLSAVRFVTSVRERLGVRLPLAALFRTPTVEELAVTVRHEQPEQRSLVALRSGGSRPPLFLVHPAGGTVFCYSHLTQHLGSDQPVYGLQALGLDGAQPPLQTFEDMAARYLHEVRALQPQGPYRLGGWSLGGLVAFEMAQQLRTAGASVELLVLLDTHAPSQDGNEAVGEEEDTEEQATSDDLDIDALVTLLGSELELSTEALKPLGPEERIDHIVAAARQADVIPLDFGREEAGQLLRVYHGINTARARYVPRPYPGDVHLFSSEQGTSGEWVKRLANVEVSTVPGNHQTMLSPPHVGALARTLEMVLTGR